ncbi:MULTISPECIES: hypothetical protein [Brucella/Ochrobactrum group]|jgi:hypothetical protein|uniref:hypothetical protein n=1 Tax=Brucella/Ochrobactrum group TaxID=2826938 RepID=UPI0013B3FFA7|nr:MULTISPECIES: hypothetical protein [Brucella/Ochrobactrum group]MCO7726404.1 hypothetical protein [Brucella intermedia]
MIKFVTIQPGKEGDRLELLRVATLNGGLLTAMRKADFQAKELAETMALAHGGQWQARIDHQRMTVLVWKADA